MTKIIRLIVKILDKYRYINKTKITEITMSKVASYKGEEEVKINDLKYINLFYGLNGTGKTTLSRFLAQCEGDKMEKNSNDEFNSCKIKTDDSEISPLIRPLVYNKDFVEKNFVEKENMKGIFTLDEKNKDRIEEINELKKETTKLEKDKTETEDKQKNNEKDLIDLLWEENPTRKDKRFKELTKGYYTSKKKFADAIIGAHNIDTTNIDNELTKLKQEFLDLTADDTKEKVTLAPLELKVIDDEAKNLLKEKIVSSGDSYLSEIIEDLKHTKSHTPWIKHGIDHYLDETDNCPFCKQDMTEELKTQIRNSIDDSYKKKTAELKELKSSYKTQYNTLKTQIDYTKAEGELGKHTDFTTKAIELKAKCENVIEKLGQKIRNPGEAIELPDTDSFLTELNDIITAKNEQITKFNKNLKNKASKTGELKRLFCSLIHAKHKDRIEEYTRKDEELEKKLKRKERAIKRINKEIDESKENLTDVIKAIANINNNLRLCSLVGFKIDIYNPDKKAQNTGQDENTGQDDSKKEIWYRIVRDGESETDSKKSTFKTLSEGEKTIISFLYFLELCKDTNETELANRIIVIDDPISSLSFDLVYEVAYLIKQLFYITKDENKSDQNKEKFGQIFILTHHLYFLHEIIRIGSTKTQWSFYRLKKINKTTDIVTMKQDDIKNSYETYWQVLKDIKKDLNDNKNSDSKYDIMLPNIMRNILEHYFSFIHKKDDFQKTLETMKTQKQNKHQSDTEYKYYNVFYRYINRGSHSDRENIVDSSDIDNEKFLEYFKRVFEDTGNLEHYNKMIEDNKNKTENKSKRENAS